ncbi:MAG: rplJ [Frankiales bacterium]|nr:rplJ [Frankiales bacterium]
MPTQAKAAVIDEITQRFQQSSAAVLTEYRGLTVAQLTQLRRSLGEGSSYAVVKNTLTKRAAESVGFSDLTPLLNGPTAIAFIEGDPVEAAKAIRDFARANPLLVVKGGVVEGRTVDAREVTRLADVESREVLLARLAGAMKGNLTKAAGLFQAPLSQVARLAAALEEKKRTASPDEADQADAAPAAGTTDADATAVAGTAADTTPTDAAADAESPAGTD